MNWTKEQEQAIYEDGKDILVAAAAGSGKTAVLVERIIQKITRENDPYEIDEMLVATFTNAAAQEMRTRVGQALEKALAEFPDSQHLRKQLSLLQKAHISTLHAFCMEVVRKYGFELEIDPGFRILDDVESDLLRNDLLQETFEEWYGKEGEEQEAFFRFVDSFSNDRNDQAVMDLVLKVYEFSRQHPDPDDWLDRLSGSYEVHDDMSMDELEWMPIVRKDIEEKVDAMEFEALQALEMAQFPEGPAHYVDTLEKDLQQIQLVKHSLQQPWEQLYELFHEQKTFGRLSGKKAECDEDLKKSVKDLRDKFKKRMEKLVERWFSRHPDSLLNDLQKIKPQIEQLVTVVKEFHEKFQQEKKEQAVVDFSDLEHYCVQILSDGKDEAGEYIPSYIANQYRKQFREVLIDEYQDTNLVQEAILQLLTAGEDAGQLFMVGDVKQSIYRFRHAEPTLFMKKYKDFQREELAATRIDLARNFRSRKEVLDGANFIFRQLLDERVGEMEYEKEAELIYSNKVYEKLTTTNVDCELHVVRKDEGDSVENDEWKYLKDAQIEARTYAKKIKDWIENSQIIDKGTEQPRSIQYRDIVVLMRSMTWAPVIEDELKQMGIPVYADLSTGYLEAMEIQVMMNVLRIIDNPMQDIPLASVLKSPIVGITEDGLAKIRLKGKRESFYQAMLNYIQAGEDSSLVDQLKQLKELLESWREEARYGSLSKLIWKIYRDTAYFEYVGGTPGGKQRQANLRALYDRARSYERSSYQGLFRFLRFIERMEERNKNLASARALGEQEDVVRIMTIHSSKGLEFPYVILGAAGRQFNQQDTKGRYILHKDYGLASKYMDVDQRILYDTFPFEALKVATARESLAEEMRVLYVALTRAKEKLVVVGQSKDWQKQLEKWNEVANHSEWVLPPHTRTDQATYLNWIGSALIRHQQNDDLRISGLSGAIPEEIRQDESKWTIHVDHASEYLDPEWITAERDEKLYKAIQQWRADYLPERSEQYEEVDRRLRFRYPYQTSADKRAKQTVTEIKRLRQPVDEYGAADIVSQRPRISLERPRFMQVDQKPLTKAEAGSAMHTMMQHIPVNKEWNAEQLEEFIQELVFKEALTPDEGDVINREAILTLMNSDVGAMLTNAVSVEREIPFTMEIAASKIYPDWEDPTDESVLVQGVIDCLVETENGYELIDYKTDTITGELTDEKINDLKQRYETQVELYKQAIEMIWNIELNHVYLYFFDRNLLIDTNEE
ncbi:helicase-exonuclease AddAB subunit AddA [Allobacillus sp. GCM10007491]|uniref:ATP-dependent helicase/nuclease subunit A n=1 Tax=Allobacillus saliphilus TaxID=2912308 RepID=A0A941CXH8_9BACI|nr:helicase-exonuclease AddAB subunit AddA [Allobacillus saliphilus]MBR7554976.1 helicase-exonuclease AddAB subunit AddA [Allobacillus saliphilus]